MLCATLVESPCRQEGPHGVQWPDLQFLSHQNCMSNNPFSSQTPCPVVFNYSREQITPHTPCPLQLPGSTHMEQLSTGGSMCTELWAELLQTLLNPR